MRKKSELSKEIKEYENLLFKFFVRFKEIAEKIPSVVFRLPINVDMKTGKSNLAIDQETLKKIEKDDEIKDKIIPFIEHLIMNYKDKLGHPKLLEPVSHVHNMLIQSELRKELMNGNKFKEEEITQLIDSAKDKLDNQQLLDPILLEYYIIKELANRPESKSKSKNKEYTKIIDSLQNKVNDRLSKPHTSLIYQPFNIKKKIFKETKITIHHSDTKKENKGEWLTVSWEEVLNLKPKLENIFVGIHKLSQGNLPREQESKKKKIFDILKKNISLEEFDILLAFHNISTYDLDKHLTERCEYYQNITTPFSGKDFDKLKRCDFWSIYKRIIALLGVKISDDFESEIKKYLAHAGYSIITTQFSNNYKYNNKTFDTRDIELLNNNGSIELVQERLYDNIPFIDFSVKQYEVWLHICKLANEQKLGIKTNVLTFQSQRDLFGEKKRDLWKPFLDLSQTTQQIVFRYIENGEYYNVTANDYLFVIWYASKGRQVNKLTKNTIPDSYFLKFNPVILKGFSEGEGKRFLNCNLVDELREALSDIGMKRLQDYHVKFAFWVQTHEHSDTKNIKRRFDNLCHEMHFNKRNLHLSTKQKENRIKESCELLQAAKIVSKYKIGKTCHFDLNSKNVYHKGK